MKKEPLFSIIIPLKKISSYLCRETIPAILEQSYQNFEIIIVGGSKAGPADKRDLGAKKAQGEILAFIDDDSYPTKNWLKNALRLIKPKNITAVCGPTLTPSQDNFYQRIAGYVWGSSLGSRGAGLYRYIVDRPREVDDFPTANLLVKKKDFWQVGGFQTHFWSGEDTKLCWQLTHQLKKKIIYHPQIIVYHHRREIFLPHLKQISRYGLHRGHFARIMPETSLRIGYLLPSLFVIDLLGMPILIFFLKNPILFLFYFFSLLIYFLLLLFTGLRVFWKEKKLSAFFLVILAIFFTHLIYGLFFLRGFFTRRLQE